MNIFTVFTKMCTSCTLIVTFWFAWFCHAQDLFFKAERYYSVTFVCVTNSSFALSWIKFDVREKLNYVSSFIPTPQPNTFDHAINGDAETMSTFLKEPWSLRNTVNLTKNEMILDRRWEEIPVYLTKGVNEYEADLEYRPILSSLRDNFEIPLSIRTEKEAHLFLCDGKYPPTSNCYWFMLQAWHRTRSAIRKCPKNQIQKIDRTFPGEPCKTTFSTKNHTTGYPTIFSEKSCSHFKITKTGNTLIFSHKDKNGTENRILNHQDMEDPIYVTHLIIHSKFVNGLWKIHNIEFIYTRQESDNVHLGPLIYSQRNNYLCISMFVSMCSSCKIKLTVARANSSDIVGEKTFYFQNAEWSEVKFIVENVENYNAFKLLVTTIGSDPDKFWAIDSVRLCQKTEFRLITLSEQADCQLVSYEDNKISLPLPLSESENTCPEDTIGDLCVPCNWIFTDCSAITVCDKAKCVCSAGYSSNSCYYQCPEHSYGHGCRKQCGNCYYNTCNHINGICSNSYCKNNYTGPRCDIRPVIIFTKLPEIITEYSNATVTVSNFETENGLDNEKPQSYLIQFKKADSSRVWSSNNQSIHFGTNTSVSINNLEANTEYFVRAVIISDKGNTYDGESYVNDAKFWTKCYDPSAENTEIKPTNTSVIITQKHREICKINQYYICITPKITSESGCTRPTFVNDSLVYFDSLSPFTYYTVTFQQLFNVTFRTAEGVPNSVRHLLVYSKDEHSISLRWKPPYPPNGILKDYQINYFYTGWRNNKYGVHTVTVNTQPCSLWPDFHCAKLSELVQEKTYTINIRARNKQPTGLGALETIRTETKKEPPEQPYDLVTKWTSQNDLELEWKHPNQSNGDIVYFEIILTSSDEEIKDKLPIINKTYQLIYQSKINSAKIVPAISYDVKIAANNREQGKTAFKTVTSPPDIPKLINGLQVNKTNDLKPKLSISLQKIRGQTDNYCLIILISKSGENSSSSYPELKRLGLDNSKIVFNCSLNNTVSVFNLTIGETKHSSPLQPATSYNITALLVNTFAGESRYSIYSIQYSTEANNNYLYILLLLLVIIPIVAFFYVKREQIKRHKMANSAASDIPLTTNISTKVENSQFYNYLKKVSESGELKRQHQEISKTSTTYEQVSNSFPMEYIDVNFSKGQQLKKVYVATQIPEKKDIELFWKIIWNDNVQNIVLFDNICTVEKPSFKKYWPEDNKTFQYDDLFVEHDSTEDYEFVSRRRFTLSFNNIKQQIEQLHFSFNTTERLSTLHSIAFFQKMCEIPLNSTSPILVQNSYGMCGNGFVLLCDISIREAKREGAIDVMDNFRQLVQQSSQLTIDDHHYLLAHKVILDVLLHVDTNIATSIPVFDTVEIDKKLKYLEDTLWLDTTTKDPLRESKIYYQDAPAIYVNETVFTPYSLDKGESFYITFDRYRSPGKFIVAPGPTSNTVSQFWSLIEEKNISAIFCLDENMSVWPNSELPQIKLKNDTKIQHKITKNFKCYDWITVEMENKEKMLTVDIFRMKNWPAQSPCPPNVSDFVTFSSETNEILKKHDSVVVTRHDGLTACGIYIAMAYNIQKVRFEGISDMCTCIRAVRRQDDTFLNDENQQKFLLEAAYKYLNEFNLYETR